MGPHKNLETSNIDLMPTNVVSESIANECKSIAYTYSEPVTFYEYMFDTAFLAQKNKIGNIMVSNEQLKLLDYDGLYVPGLEVIPSKEWGHRNYQHPARSEKDYGPSLDHFSTWIIYISIFGAAYLVVRGLDNYTKNKKT